MDKSDATIIDSDLGRRLGDGPPPERLYRIGTIIGITVFASAVAGAVLMMYNDRQLREGRSAIHLLAGVGITAMVFVIAGWLLPEGAGIVATGLQVGAMYGYVNWAQGPQITAWQEAGGRPASPWLPAGIALGVLALLLFAIIVLDAAQ